MSECKQVHLQPDQGDRYKLQVPSQRMQGWHRLFFVEQISICVFVDSGPLVVALRVSLVLEKRVLVVETQASRGDGQ